MVSKAYRLLARRDGPVPDMFTFTIEGGGAFHHSINCKHRYMTDIREGYNDGIGRLHARNKFRK